LRDVQALVVDDRVPSRGVGEALMRGAWAAARGLPATSLYTGIKLQRDIAQ
jgi:hypothetical protein